MSQLREVTARLTELSKRERIATFLVGHVTKEGQLAGPKVLEHLVDTVLSFEGERGSRVPRAAHDQEPLRLGHRGRRLRDDAPRACARWPNRRRSFWPSARAGASGSVVAATAEGARPLLVEVQALVGRSGFASPRRTATGVDGGRARDVPRGA